MKKCTRTEGIEKESHKLFLHTAAVFGLFSSILISDQ